MPQSLPATRSTAAAGVAEAEAADYVRSDYLIIFARSAGSFGRGELLNTNKRMSTISAAAFADTKPHYDILDGLRGIAALTVVWFHIFEAFATSHLDQRINHGYLAVDFFFILSGFVIGYAYDDRWKKMTVAEFLKRRLIRLHPMVVIGALIGAVMFYFQGCSVWDVTKVTVPMLLAATLMNACLIPASPGTEIRGLSEMYPLNGPSWSLFFEYAGNILYAFFIRKLSTRALSVVVFLAGCGLAAFAVWGPLGDICVGFAMTEENMVGGSLRLMFAFSAGCCSRAYSNPCISGAPSGYAACASSPCCRFRASAAVRICG